MYEGPYDLPVPEYSISTESNQIHCIEIDSPARLGIFGEALQFLRKLRHSSPMFFGLPFAR